MRSVHVKVTEQPCGPPVSLQSTTQRSPILRCYEPRECSVGRFISIFFFSRPMTTFLLCGVSSVQPFCCAFDILTFPAEALQDKIPFSALEIFCGFRFFGRRYS